MCKKYRHSSIGTTCSEQVSLEATQLNRMVRLIIDGHAKLSFQWKVIKKFLLHSCSNRLCFCHSISKVSDLLLDFELLSMISRMVNLWSHVKLHQMHCEAFNHIYLITTSATKLTFAHKNATYEIKACVGILQYRWQWIDYVKKCDYQWQFITHSLHKSNSHLLPYIANLFSHSLRHCSNTA